MKRWIVNKLLKYLFNAVTEDDVLKYQNGLLFRGKKALSQMEVSELQNEAETLQRMKLWQQLVKEMQWVANDLIFNKSEKPDDLIFPKAVLYTLDVMQQKIKNLSQLK